ncbi:MAG: guanylate kinase [Paludibacteraceae bacterium]|nr:guanylate kinase [Paludibacteraceae bacterium]
MNTKLIVFSAPSGCGKSTIISELRKRGVSFAFSISATSRKPRGEEKDGVEYYFLTPEQFRTKIAENCFVEYEEVYKDQFYGTLKSEVERLLRQGTNVLFDIDVKGALNIKRFYGDKAVLIFIMPPSVEELSRRLHSRGTESEELIQKRLSRAEFEMSFSPQFDHCVVNDNLEDAVSKVYDIIAEANK